MYTDSGQEAQAGISMPLTSADSIVELRRFG
jgi:hypothetical protein